MSNNMLPAGFQDLEPFVGEWSLPTEKERNAKRLSSSMKEIQSLYDTLLPKMNEVIGHLNQFPLNEMPEDAKRLLRLTLSLAEIAPAVEFYQQPEVVDGFPSSRFIPLDINDSAESEL